MKNTFSKLTLSLAFLSTTSLSLADTIGQRIDNTTDYLKLKTKVLTALAKQGLPISDIATNINGSTVQLCGFINSTEGKAAVQTATNVDGVKKVINGLVYTDSVMTKLSANENGGYINSAKITAVTKSELFMTKVVPAASINVQTYRGIVNLCGFVDNKYQQTTALDTAGKVEGVRKVINNLVAGD